MLNVVRSPESEAGDGIVSDFEKLKQDLLTYQRLAMAEPYSEAKSSLLANLTQSFQQA